MSLPLSHAGGSVDGISAALDLRFASSLSLTSTSGITPSFSRASTGTYFNSSGVLSSAAINGPRFNHVYNGSSWVSKGLLVEEQRTNLFNNSVNLYTGWTNSGFITDSNKTLAPDALTLVDKLIPETGNTDAKTYKATSITNGLSYSYSVYIKKSELYRARLQFYDGGFYYSIFDVNSGTIISTTGGLTSEISNAGNGWYRCTIKKVSALTGSGFFYVLPEDATPGNGTSGFYAWGAQLEAGAYPTSYIPTTSAAVTRSADVCQITGGDFSGMWNASEGSFAVEWDSIYDAAQASSRRLFLVQNSDATARLNSEINNGSINWETVPAGANLSAAFTLSANQMVKNSFAYKINDFALVLNGGVVGTDTSVNVPSGLTILNIGNGVSTTHSGHIARLRYYPTRLPNATLQVLST